MTQHIKTWQDRLGNSAHIKSGGAVGEAMQAEIDELRAALAQPASIDSIDTSMERVHETSKSVQVAQPASEPAAVSGWLPIESAPKVKRTNKPWDESDRVVVRIEHNRDVYAAFGRYIHSHATGYEWLVEGHGGDWSNRVTGWLPLPVAPTVDEDGKLKPRN